MHCLFVDLLIQMLLDVERIFLSLNIELVAVSNKSLKRLFKLNLKYSLCIIFTLPEFDPLLCRIYSGLTEEVVVFSSDLSPSNLIWGLIGRVHIYLVAISSGALRRLPKRIYWWCSGGSLMWFALWSNSLVLRVRGSPTENMWSIQTFHQPNTSFWWKGRGKSLLSSHCSTPVLNVQARSRCLHVSNLCQYAWIMLFIPDMSDG